VIQFKPLTASFGVEVSGLDLRRPIEPATVRRLREAFERHDLLLVRDADLDAADQLRFAGIFGTVEVRKGAPQEAMPDEPKTQYISNSRKDGILGDGELVYHQDHLFHPSPLRGLILYGMEVPASGSATKFRSCHAIYRSLDAAQRAQAETVRCLHLFDYEAADYGNFTLEGASPAAPRAWQPLVWRDAPRGPAIWAVHGTTVAFEGIGEREGWTLLDAIVERAAGIEEYVHQWRLGDLVLWNNLTLQHARTPFDPAESRTLRRTPLV
jgi:alpha-ketoglutarate-dependent taurine dioxygenase